MPSASMTLSPVMDGYVQYYGAALESWETVFSAIAGTSVSTAGIYNNCNCRYVAATNRRSCDRAFYTYDIYPLGGMNRTITSATFYFYGAWTSESTASYYITAGTLADPMTITVDDYPSVGAAWSEKTLAAEDAWYSVSLNATGLAAISGNKRTITFAMRHYTDVEATGSGDVVWGGNPRSLEYSTGVGVPYGVFEYTFMAPMVSFIAYPL